MPFQIKPIREFLVRPSMPPALSRMPELAYNIAWSWEPIIRALFRRLDPVLWRESRYNPVVLLGRVSQPTLDRAASDPRYVAMYTQACDAYDAQVKTTKEEAAGDELIGYFSAEYGMTECLPIYSGGLGMLSGDHLKSASDCKIPLVGVGLLYQGGYFRQYLNPDGWQQERYPTNDFFTLPVMPVLDSAGLNLKVPVKLPSGLVWIQVWCIKVGRVSLYLLDTNIPDNPLQQDREITDQLYGGDNDKRIRQEIVLGIGGLRTLKAVGVQPTVYHMNEGHSAFLAIERVRLLMQEQRLTFEEALEACRVNNVFTTHTPVPAGIDLFDVGMMQFYFEEYCEHAGIRFDQFLGLGRRNPGDGAERFSMAIMALKTASYRNGVSRLHRAVSQELWSELWPQLPVWEVPITSVTNGVHLPSWLNGDLAALYDQYLQPDWRDPFVDRKVWEQVREIPEEELLEAHRRRKRRLIAFVRSVQTEAAMRRKVSSGELQRAGEVLDPNALTIGFARRFATYKRATLLFRDMDRLRKILCDKDRPVQVIIAGKAHPRDQPGKTFIREIVQLSRDPELWKRLVFVEDYDMKVAREMVQGVDLWLNTPRRGEEACGTSGMKAGINGVLNLSILDGWFDEAYENSGGWAIGDREPYWEEQDSIHSSAIYYLLEHEIVPMFYAHRENATGEEWTRRMKQSLMYLSPQFDARRMVLEYHSQLYLPAHAAFTALRQGNFQNAREKALWNARVAQAWDRVRIVESSPATPGTITGANQIVVRAAVDLAGLKPADVRVEAVLGRVGPNGTLEDTEIIVLPVAGDSGGFTVFAKDIAPRYTGRLGYALRVSPNHYEDPLTRPCPDFLRWS